MIFKLTLFAALLALVTYLITPEFPVHESGIVLISGASTGIGRHAAEYLAESGFTVFAGVRKQSDFDEINALKNPKLQPIVFDVTNHDSNVKAVEYLKAYSSTNLQSFCVLLPLTFGSSISPPTKKTVMIIIIMDLQMDIKKQLIVDCTGLKVQTVLSKGIRLC